MPAISFTSPVEGFVVATNSLVINGAVLSFYTQVTVRVTRPDGIQEFRVNVDGVTHNFSLTIPIAQGATVVPLTLDAYESLTESASIDHAVPVHGTIAIKVVAPGTKLFSLGVAGNKFSVTAPITQGTSDLPIAVRAGSGAVLATPVSGTIAGPPPPSVTVVRRPPAGREQVTLVRSKQLNMDRMRTTTGSINPPVQVPKMPELPAELLARYPQMHDWMREMHAWRETFSSELLNKLSIPERGNPPSKE